MSLFQTGQIPHNTLTDGAITERTSSSKSKVKYKYVRLASGKWRELHKINWEAINGAIPKGNILRCIDGNSLNCDASNWRLITMAENLRLNQNQEKKKASFKATSLKKKMSILPELKAQYKTLLKQAEKIKRRIEKAGETVEGEVVPGKTTRELRREQKERSRQQAKERWKAERMQAKEQRLAAQKLQGEEDAKAKIEAKKLREKNKEQARLERIKQRELEREAKKQGNILARQQPAKQKLQPAKEKRATRAYKKREPKTSDAPVTKVSSVLIAERKQDAARLATKKVDYSQKRLLKVDAKTSIYIGKDEDPEDAKHRFYKAYARAVDVPFSR